MEKQTENSMQDLKPTVWIGKQGCTETMIEEIASQLKKRKLIKVKWLQNTDVDPKEVAAQAKAKLVEVRGRTMVLAEKGKTVPASGRGATQPAAAKGKAPSQKTPAVKPRHTGRMQAVRKAQEK